VIEGERNVRFRSAMHGRMVPQKEVKDVHGLLCMV